jgi:hypothetical protein
MLIFGTVPGTGKLSTGTVRSPVGGFKVRSNLMGRVD